MSEKLRVIHYLNQFFGGMGAEEAAYTPVQVKEGAVGPARPMQQALGDAATIVATIVAGDNYFVEEPGALSEAGAILDEYRPDVLVAGPAFDAGRYGLACAMMCRLAQEKGIPAVTAMHPENVGVTTYRKEVIAVPTGTNVAEMQSALGNMARLALKLARGEEPGPAAVDGYIPRGYRRHITRDKLGYERAVDMLVARTTGKPYQSEVLIKTYEEVPPAPPLVDLKGATLALVTSGGLVPRGNPDRLVSGRATEFFKYSIEGLRGLSKDEWESVHGGFNTTILNTIDPSYALPLPVVREFQDQGMFKSLYPYYFATTGNGTAVSEATRMGREIAREIKAAGVAGVLLVATWGSCNRCGATISKQIEREGIPVAIMSAIPLIPITVGANRVIRGVRVPHVVGDPSLSREKDMEVRTRIVMTAMRALQTPVSGPTLFEPSDTPLLEAVHGS